VNDFDGNGTAESVISYYWPDGKSHLYNSKVDITAQLPYLKKKVLFYKDYAGKSVKDIFGNELINKSAKLAIQTLATSILFNNSNVHPKGEAAQVNFKLSALPVMAQLSPVFVMIADDFDKDGNIDIFMGGNFTDVKPDIGRLDANAASLLHGDGKGGFKFVSPTVSGLAVKGQLRDAIEITVKNNKLLALARNNDGLIFIQPK
jgi:enediyne biosynthesis protein E4